MKLKINLSAIVSPHAVSRDQITGSIDDLPITISRRLSGWTPSIVIVIDGVTVHDTTASSDDMSQYNTLLERAQNDRFDFQSSKRSEILASDAFKSVFVAA